MGVVARVMGVALFGRNERQCGAYSREDKWARPVSDAQGQSSWMPHGGLLWIVQALCVRLLRPDKVHLAVPAIGVVLMDPLSWNPHAHDGPSEARSPWARRHAMK